MKYQVLMATVSKKSAELDIARLGWELAGGVAMHWNGQVIQLAQAVVEKESANEKPTK